MIKYLKISGYFNGCLLVKAGQVAPRKNKALVWRWELDPGQACQYHHGWNHPRKVDELQVKRSASKSHKKTELINICKSIPKYNLHRERVKVCRESPEQKKPWPSSQRPPRSFPSAIGLSNLIPILKDRLLQKLETPALHNQKLVPCN